MDIERGVVDMAEPGANTELKPGPAKPCCLTFEAINYAIKVGKNKTKTILNNVSGCVTPGEVLAILGPSGSGKTSLLDVIARRVRSRGVSLSGEVLFNGCHLNERQRRQFMSYVAQEDALMGILTVRESLWFAARFFYGYSVDIKLIGEKIESIIDSVGLRSCADTIVGNVFMKGLSGGQQRRLSVAVELVSSPAILLLDEPTSGLDSASAFAIMSELRTLAQLGHTILCTIHQPSSEIWAQFDQFMLLAEGNVCYMGEAKKAMAYFDGVGYECPPLFNPADFVINLVATDFDVMLFKRPESVKHLAETYQGSALRDITFGRIAELKKLSSGDTSKQRSLWGHVSFHSGTMDQQDDFEAQGNCASLCLASGRGSASSLDHFLTITHRNLLNLVRNPGILMVRLVMYTMLSVFLGLIYFELGTDFTTQGALARLSLIFCSYIFFNVMCMAVIPFVEIERQLFLRERRNGAYQAAPYVLAHFMAMIPGTLVLVTISSILIVYMAKLNGIVYFFLTFWATLLAAECFAYFLASICPHYIIAIALMAGTFGLFAAVQGFLKVFSEIPWVMRWIGYISPIRYGFRALARNEFAHMSDPFVNADGTVGFSNGTSVLEFYDLVSPESNMVQSIGADICIIFAFALSYLFLFYLVCEFYRR